MTPFVLGTAAMVAGSLIGGFRVARVRMAEI